MLNLSEMKDKLPLKLQLIFMKSFEKWKYPELKNEFGLERVYKQNELIEWLRNEN